MKQEKFNEQLRQRLSGAEISPPAGLWSRIEGSMEQIDAASKAEQRPPTTLRRPRWRLNGRTAWGYVAAAVVLVGVVVAGLNRSVDPTMIAEADMVVQQQIEANGLAEVIPVSDSVATQNSVAVATDVWRDSKSLGDIRVVSEPQSIESQQESQQEPQQEAQQEPQRESQPQTAPLRDRVAEQPKKRVTHNVFAQDRGVKKRRGGGIEAGVYAANIATSVASGSVSEPSARAMMAFSVSEMIRVPDGSLVPTKINIPTPDLKHKMPVSFGVAASYSFTPKLALETGVVYTKLTSEATSRGAYDANYKIKQSLHYIGVPLSAKYKIAGNNTFSVYAKAGGMVELAVGAKRSEEISGSSFSTKIDVDGVQGSIHAALGAQVNLTKGLGLYVEPGVAHYFDCGQPDNYRTANPTNFSLSAGLRINIR